MAKNVKWTAQGDKARVSGICTVTGSEYAVELTMDQFYAWKQGGYIQDVAPQLSAEQREFLITRMTPAEWNAMFPPEKV